MDEARGNGRLNGTKRTVSKERDILDRRDIHIPSKEKGMRGEGGE
jgi:hypothetical protein